MVDLNHVGVSQEALVLILEVLLNSGRKFELVQALRTRLREQARTKGRVPRAVPVMAISEEDQLVQIKSIDFLMGAVLPQSVLLGLVGRARGV